MRYGDFIIIIDKLGIVINENIMREEILLVIIDFLIFRFMLNFIKILELYIIITCKIIRKKNIGNC